MMYNNYLCLLHYPVYNKHRDIVTTAVTNFDIHDLARTAKTYGIKEYFLVHPVREQVGMVCKLIDHWRTGFGSTFNPDRKEALDAVSVASTLDEVIGKIGGLEGVMPKLVFTGAKIMGRVWSYGDLRLEIGKQAHPFLFILGTGHGIEKSFFSRADYVLAPIVGPAEYNHLCVRAAGAIILDRLFGVNP